MPNRPIQEIKFTVVLVVLSLAGLPALAVVGTPGTPGVNGAPASGGGAGGDASDSESSTATTAGVIATATGGAGGNGGSATVSPFAAGAGGAGGNGTASLTGAVGANLSTDSANATGGGGGTGGTGAPGNGVNGGGRGGAGGAGGNATVNSSLDDTSGHTVTQNLDADGGIGGDGGPGGAKGGKNTFAGPMGYGGAGGVATLGSFTGSSAAYPNFVTNLYLNGGAGGAGSTGGAGGSEMLYLNVSGYTNSISTPYPTTINDELVGGAGGSGVGGAGGVGGTADAEINTNPGLSMPAIAYGGNGGAASNGNGANGGDSIAVDSTTTGQPAFAFANADSNILLPRMAVGGNVTGGTGNGGDGGNARATANSSGTTANATASAAGGHGGNVLTPASGNGGNGGNAAVSSVVSDSNANGVNSTLSAYGGDGGVGIGSGFAGGNGGTATINSSASSSTGGVTYSIYAQGGNGGSGQGFATGGNGGAVNLTNAVAAGSYGPLFIGVQVVGGNTGGSDSVADGIAGSAMISQSYNTFGAFSGSFTAAAGSGINANAANGTVSISVNAAGSISLSGFTNTDDPDSSNTGTRTGGAGGDSITRGLTGGIANTTLSATSTNANAGSSAVSVRGFAFGGSGGYGGYGGTVTIQHSGGAGGSATGSATAVNINGLDPVTAAIETVGGTGGTGLNVGNFGGAGGTADALTASATSRYAPASASVTAYGGNGGIGFNHANGGTGASVNLANVVTGSTTNELDLTENAFGGSAGPADSGTAGVAGNATAMLTLTDTSSSYVAAVVSAMGGGGGNNRNASGSAGGNAVASINITGNYRVNALANSPASPKSGGSISSSTGGFVGGDGGSDTCTATALSNSLVANTSGVSADADAFGQPGGSGGTANGTTTFGSGGTGGVASATANAVGNGADPVIAIGNSFAGAGGEGNGSPQHGGYGGNATATATASDNNGTIGSANATANANGGAAGVASGRTMPGTTGTAFSTASATAAISAVATAAATGSSGIATSTSRVLPPSGLFAFVRGATSNVVDRTGGANGQSEASFGTLDFGVNSSLSTVAYVSDQPPAANVSSAWSTDSNVMTVFNNAPSNASALTLTQLLDTTSTTATTQTYSAVQDLNLASSNLNGNSLVLGLLGETFTGSGLQSGDTLRLRVQRAGTTYIDRTFATNADLDHFLNNTLIDLGTSADSLTPGNLDVQVLFDLTTAHPNSGLSNQFVFGSLPHGTRSWQSTTGGSWNDPASWQNNTLPNGPGTSVVFSSTSPQTITLDAPTTVGVAGFNNTGAFSITPGNSGTLLFDNAGNVAQINVTAGGHSISAPITIASPGLVIDIANGSTLTLSGAISGMGAITKTDNGAMLLTTASPVSNLAINGGKIILMPGSKSVLITGNVATTGSGSQLDLTNNDLIVSGGSFSSIQSQIASAYDGGKWDLTGITSSSAAAKSTTYALGYATAGEIGVSNFDNQPVTSGETLVKYTLLGDSTLKGSVGLVDLLAVKANLGAPNTDWAHGNFHYSGSTALSDLLDVKSSLGAVAAANVTAARSAAVKVNAAIAGSNDLHLQVNTITGDVSLVNVASAATAFTAYQINVTNNNSPAVLNIGNPSPDSSNTISSGSGNAPFTGEKLLSEPNSSSLNFNTTAFALGNDPTLWELDQDGFNSNGTGFGLVEGPSTFVNMPTSKQRSNAVTIPAGGSIDLGNIFMNLAPQNTLSFTFAPTNAAGGDSTITYSGSIDYLSGSTPEPGGISIVILGICGLLRRDRRESRCPEN